MIIKRKLPAFQPKQLRVQEFKIKEFKPQEFKPKKFEIGRAKQG